MPEGPVKTSVKEVRSRTVLVGLLRLSSVFGVEDDSISRLNILVGKPIRMTNEIRHFAVLGIRAIKGKIPANIAASENLQHEALIREFACVSDGAYFDVHVLTAFEMTAPIIRTIPTSNESHPKGWVAHADGARPMKIAPTVRATP